MYLHLSYILATNAWSQSLLVPNETASSPSHIIRKKGATVWLHWSYTYIGDRNTELFTIRHKEEVIQQNSTLNPNMRILARRTGQTGVLKLEPSIPAPLKGRIRVISSNSTLVIRDLQYNDSIYHFASHVVIYVDQTPHTFELKPVVSLTVQGMILLSLICMLLFILIQ